LTEEQGRSDDNHRKKSDEQGVFHHGSTLTSNAPAVDVSGGPVSVRYKGVRPNGGQR
jgi:hypothetical protein